VIKEARIAPVKEKKKKEKKKGYPLSCGTTYYSCWQWHKGCMAMPALSIHVFYLSFARGLEVSVSSHYTAV